MSENTHYWRVKKDTTNPMWSKLCEVFEQNEVRTNDSDWWVYFGFTRIGYDAWPEYNCTHNKLPLITIDEACERLGIK